MSESLWGVSSPFGGSSRTELETVIHAPSHTHSQLLFPMVKYDSCIELLEYCRDVSYDLVEFTKDSYNNFCIGTSVVPSLVQVDNDKMREQPGSHNLRNDRGIDASGPLRGLYRYTQELCQLEACRAASIPRLPEYATIITTPLVAATWKKALQDHPDREFCSYVVHGIKEGFHVGFDGILCTPWGARFNMRSVDENPTPVDDYLAVELAAGRIVEVDSKAVPDLVISRFGVIPK